MRIEIESPIRLAHSFERIGLRQPREPIPIKAIHEEKDDTQNSSESVTSPPRQMHQLNKILMAFTDMAIEEPSDSILGSAKNGK